MTYFAALGVPLDLLNYLSGPVLQYMRLLMATANYRRQTIQMAKRHIHLSAGDQYRMHMRAGGYRP